MRQVFLLAALGLLIFSCAEPDMESRFVKVKDAENGFYLFTVDMSDSLSSYDFGFYFRADRPFADSRQYDIPVDVSWVSPSSMIKLKERVYLIGRGDEDRVLQYRTGVRTSETGEWTIQLYPREVPDGFQGIGLTMKRNGAR